MMDVQLRRAGLGPAPAAGFQAGRTGGVAGGPSGGPPGGGASPSGLGGPSPRFKLSGAQYAAGRTGWKSFLHQRSAAKQGARAKRQTARNKMSELTGGRLSTGRSHRGFASAMGAYARREAREPAQGGGGPASQALTPRNASAPPGAVDAYRPGGSGGAGGRGGASLHAAMDAYFSRRESRREKYSAMRGGVAPQRSAMPPTFGAQRPEPLAGSATTDPAPSPPTGPTIEEVGDDEHDIADASDASG